MRPVAWLDGSLQPLAAARDRIAGGLQPDGPGCYSTARWCGTGLRHGERCAQRLARDAARLGFGPLDAADCARAMAALGEAAFGAGEGIVRFSAGRDVSGRTELLGLPRALGEEAALWTAVSAPWPHDGPSRWSGVKRTDLPSVERARTHALAAGAEEALLFDSDGQLVEGARTSLFVVLEPGRLVTPPLARGGVDGVARALVLEREPEVSEADVARAQLSGALEIVATNAVRGARAVVTLDGASVGPGTPGPWAARLEALLEVAA